MAIAIYEPLTVLLIEDNRDDERLSLRALRSCGLPLFVRVARDGHIALRALGLDGSAEGQERPIPDLVISDLKMPKFGGDEVLEMARADERLQNIPFVMFSSSDRAADIERCVSFGASAYCTKSIDFDEYLGSVRQMARHWLWAAGQERTPFCVLESSEYAGMPG